MLYFILSYFIVALNFYACERLMH